MTLRPKRRPSRRPGLIAAALGGVCVLILVPAVSVSVASAATGGSNGADRHGEAQSHETSFGPVVKHTGTAPTGYDVTFRFYAPHATRVQVKGEWYFENPGALPQLSSTPGHPVQTPGLLPSQWQPGDVPMQSPNSTNPNFPVTDMTEIGHSGVWTYTTPLPAGVFIYGFFVDCQTADQSGMHGGARPRQPHLGHQTRRDRRIVDPAEHHLRALGPEVRHRELLVAETGG